jgi:uncharacterized protein YxjI
MENLAMVINALITPVRERWVVKFKNVIDLEVKGNTYGVSIDPSQEDVLILAVAVCIDEMAHGGR